MAPTTSIRWPVAKHLVDLFAASPLLDGVSIASGWPGERGITPEMIWMNTIDTVQLEVPVATGGRKHRNDTFRVRFVVRVAARPVATGADPLDVIHVRMAELVEAAENVLAEDPTLGDFDGVTSAELVDHGQQAAWFPEGLIGDGFFVVEIDSRIT